MKSYAVIGLGRFGKRIALQLAGKGCEVLAIDRDRKNVDEVAEDVTRAVTANVRDKDVLEDLGVAQCDCAILAIGGDLAASVLGVMNLKSIGVPMVICKAYDEIHREVLTKLGADQVMIPEQDAADKLAAKLTFPHLRDFIELSDDFNIEEFGAPSMWTGKTLRELRIRNVSHVSIIAIKRSDGVVVAPGADEMVLKDDVLVALGTVEALENLHRFFDGR